MDSLSIATVMSNYDVIIKTGEFEVGQTAAYIGLDAVCPDTEQFYFMCPVHRSEDGQILGKKFAVGSVPERYRVIKAKKIRNIFSAGLLVPTPTIDKVAVFMNGVPFEANEDAGFGKHIWNSSKEYSQFLVANPELLVSRKDERMEIRFVSFPMKVGESVVDYFGLKKVLEEEEENVISSGKIKEQNTHKPEGWSIPYYDKESLRKYISCLLPDEEIVLTEKCHGSNAGFCYDGNELWCKSRNNYKRGIITWTDADGIEQKVESSDQWWTCARQYGLEEKLKQHPGLVFFSECAGQIKGFPYDSKIISSKRQLCLYFFDVYDTKTMRYFDYDDRVALIKSLGLTPVPEIYRGKFLEKDKMFAFAEGKTLTGGGHIREGFVLNTVKERYEPKLNGRMSVKFVGEGYSLAK